ncbi:MAG: hypothetical protein AB7G80_06935 [Dongiaceae bacterium]
MIIFHSLADAHKEELLPRFLGPQHPAPFRQTYITELGEDKEPFLFFPSVGAIPHHFLIAPHEFYPSFAAMDPAIRAQALDMLQKMCWTYKLRTDEYPVLAEHGTAKITSPALSGEDRAHQAQGCACTDHAHMHFLPFPSAHKMKLLELCAIFGGKFDLLLSDPAEFDRLKDRPYLLVNAWKKHYFIWLDPAKKFAPFNRQWIRRAVYALRLSNYDLEKAEKIIRQPEKYDGYDWRKHPGPHIMAKSIQEMHSWFGRLYTPAEASLSDLDEEVYIVRPVGAHQKRRRNNLPAASIGRQACHHR